ncbi:MAG TPA: DNA replication and repair protein RecF [Solirubrobacteraceae bacterium]|jgi:DNA replication and repair protein RecF|nr:DNA replication and repair protein RecF [Solirubrobacteraceae bacterium]
MVGAPDDVRVLDVQMRDFRTYARAEAGLGPGLTVVHGPNGAGKSNLLEALYFGCTARSPRTRNERELIHFGAQAARVVVHCRAGAQAHELSVGYGAGPEGERATKRMTADGAPVERLLDVDFRPLLSVFEPDRLELLKGAPAARRAHLDQVIAALWPLRANDRREYSRVLAQRNALLARIRSGRASDATIAAWDRELAVAALVLRDHRSTAVELLAEPFRTRASQLGLSGDAELAYRPRTRAGDVEELIAELQARLPSDLERGFTGHGPHRDELAILRDGRELRSYGSQGEQRLALLALLLAERSVLAEHRNRTPLMLLDDVMSELDASRRELLAEELSAGGQSVIATTDLAHVPGATDATVARLRISPGSVLQEALAA